MSVLGHVLGDEQFAVIGHDDAPMEVIGYTHDGEAIVGRKHHKKRGHSRELHKPSWRDHELAPGVVEHGEGLLPLPLSPQQNGGTFTATVTNITWQGQLQKPFRSERLLVTSARTGPSSVGRLLGQIFVGVDLQQVDIPGFDLETVGGPTTFGTRLTMIQAPPGILIRIPVVLSQGLTGTDTIFASVTFLGRVVH